MCLREYHGMKPSLQSVRPQDALEIWWDPKDLCSLSDKLFTHMWSMEHPSFAHALMQRSVKQ